jgi:succinate dehydrogenase / fumarate reductase cytochrome b subunit
MSSSAPSKRERRPNTLSSGRGIIAWVEPFFRSSVGNKVLVALTGIVLTAFVVAHMIGNIQIFAGPDKLNAYAKWLKDLGPLLWIARIGLILVFVLHVYLAIRLKWRANRARPVKYVHREAIQASIASRTMVLTGFLILFFVLFHLAHFTFGWVKQVEAYDPATGRLVMSNYLAIVDAQGRHDVYRMVIAGYQDPIVSIFYIIAQLFLLLHLSHGVSSVFQTLGWNSPRFQPFSKGLGWTIALLVAVGNILIVVAVWYGWIGANLLPPIARLPIG